MSHTTPPEERLRELDRALDSPDREALLRAALNDESTLVREHAIALAARYLQPEVLGELIRDEANAVLRNAAQSALERQGPYAAEHLITLTRDDDADVALFAVQVLSKICLPSTEGALLPLVDHHDPNIAQAAIEAMGALASRAAVPRLLRLLDSDPWLQFAAVTALGQIGDGGAVEPLLARLGDELLAETIVDALGQIGAPEALLPLMEAMRAGDRLPLRDRVLLAVAAIVEKEALPAGIAASLRRYLAADESRELNEYLRLVLELDDKALAHAAVVLALAGRITSLLPAVFIRACDCSDDAADIASACERFRSGLRPQLTALLSHADVRVRKGALLAAPLDSAARDTALDFLDDENPRVRIAACTALTRAPSEKAIPRLAHLLLQGAPDEREAAVEALARCPGDLLAPVLPGLDDGIPDETQVACLRVLAGAHSLLARDRVERLLSSNALAVRRAALRVLANHPGETFISVATRCLDDAALGPDVVEHLSRTSCETASRLLLDRLDRNTDLRYHVIRALGRLGSASAVAPLVAVFPACTRHERIEVATALVHIGTADCGAFLESLLASTDGDLRRVAADGLARLAAPHHVEVLMKLAADSDWVVRNHAAWGLGRLGNPISRTTLLVLARDVTPVVARAARAALAKLDATAEGQG